MATHTAVILAAGVGSRLRPLTDEKPKALVPVAGKSILSRALDALRSVGVDRLVIASGYREDAIRRELAGAPFEVIFRANQDYAATQNSVSLAKCRDALEGDSFFRLDGDVVFDAEILLRLDSERAPLAAAVDSRRALDLEAMKVRVDPRSGWIASFGKGIPIDLAAGESIGIERIDRTASRLLFDGLDEAAARGETHLYYEDVYSQLISRGALRAAAVEVGDLRWFEIDAPDDLVSAERLFGDRP
ncbi:MAG TPA: phosphocholine cytidylyltransferase family protein [Polyangiaceae bacterium]|nr:phosphocholine cytidylyltransferase family protein [Polyangiaceae bacterium]